MERYISGFHHAASLSVPRSGGISYNLAFEGLTPATASLTPPNPTTHLTFRRHVCLSHTYFHPNCALGDYKNCKTSLIHLFVSLLPFSTVLSTWQVLRGRGEGRLWEWFKMAKKNHLSSLPAVQFTSGTTFTQYGYSGHSYHRFMKVIQ